MYIFYLHCLSFELFWLFLNWPTFWVFLFWLPPMLLNRIHLHLHVQFYVKQQYGKMLCEETNLDLLYKWKNKSHTKGPNIYTSLKANLCQGRTWGFVFSIFFLLPLSFYMRKNIIKAPAKRNVSTEMCHQRS